MNAINRTRAAMFTAMLPILFLLAACGSDENANNIGERPVTVTVETVDVVTVRTRLHSIGRLVSRNAPVLASEIDAKVVEILADEGEVVEAGQVLLRLDKTPFELARREARAQISVLEVSIANEEKRVARYRNLKHANARSVAFGM